MKCPRCGKWMAICDCSPEDLNLVEEPMPQLTNYKTQFTMQRGPDRRLHIRKDNKNR